MDSKQTFQFTREKKYLIATSNLNKTPLQFNNFEIML